MAAGGVLATSTIVRTELLAADPKQNETVSADPAAIPPHRPLTDEGIHAYANRVSVAAGDVINFYVSSSYPYELQVCRLGTDVDSPARRDPAFVRALVPRAPTNPSRLVHPD